MIEKGVENSSRHHELLCKYEDVNQVDIKFLSKSVVLIVLEL